MKDTFKFPFIGAGQGIDFETVRIYVYFTQNPVPMVRHAMVFETPPPLKASATWNARLLSVSSGPNLQAEIAAAYDKSKANNGAKRASKKGQVPSKEALEAFHRDIVRWLAHMNAVVPILFAYRPENREGGGIRLDDWHTWSTQQIPRLLLAFKTRDDAALQIRKGLAAYAPASKLKVPVERFAMLATRGDLGALRIAFANAGGVLSEEIMSTWGESVSAKRAHHTEMLVGMHDMIAVQKKLNAVLVARMGMAACRVRNDPEASRDLKAKANATYAWVLEIAANQQDVCEAMAPPAGEAARTGHWKVAIDAYEVALLGKRLEPKHYADALHAITPGINGLPLEAARAKRWLAICLRHGKSDVDIWVNGARLALVLKDVKTAKDAVRKAVAAGHPKNSLRHYWWLAPLRKEADVAELLV